jgi:hypothetical protein
VRVGERLLVAGDDTNQVHQVGDRQRQTIVINVRREDLGLEPVRIPDTVAIDEVVAEQNRITDFIRDAVDVDVAAIIRRLLDADSTLAEANELFRFILRLAFQTPSP